MRAFFFNSKLLAGFCLFVLSLLFNPGQLSAQEVRLYGSMQVFGYVNGGFNGFGVGLENPFSRRWALNADVNIGTQDRGRATEIKPALHYYFSDNHDGFFMGPSIKYTLLEERDGRQEYDDALYCVGFSLGVKTRFQDNWLFVFTANPHKSIGGRNVGDVAGLSVLLGLGYRF